MRLSKGYLQRGINGKKAYVKRESLDKLREADAVIFDCDGVLIDIRESYNRATPKTVACIIEELTGFRFPESLISKEIIYLFKRSGGFNNDWDLAYTILMCIFCKLPEDFQEALKRHMNINLHEKDVVNRFLAVKNGVRKEFDPIGLDKVMPKLGDTMKQLAKTSNLSGIASIERELMNPPNSSESFHEFCCAAKRLLSYPGGVGESLLTTTFEEIFCGPQLFRKVYNHEPRLYQGPALIENERVVFRPEAFDQLALVLEGSNFGIASGRAFPLAKHVLEGLLERFTSKALVFLDDIEVAERESERSKGQAVSLKKPNPFSLFQSSKGLKPFTFALYVGDSMEDAMVVKEANKIDARFLFVGVYGFSDCKNDVIRDFLKAEADLILPSVNELPIILKSVKGEGML